MTGRKKMSDEKYVQFPCENLILEGMLRYREGNGKFAAVIVCHPHPLYGGTMDNNVVVAICRELYSRAIISLRFNFRGVGGSQSSKAGELGEVDDVKAAISFLIGNESVDPDRIGLVGYSYGGAVSLRAAVKDSRVCAVAAVSPAIAPADMTLLKGYNRPNFLIIGSQDDIVSGKSFEQLSNLIGESKTVKVITGADHFWYGFENEMAKETVSFLHDAVNRKDV